MDENDIQIDALIERIPIERLMDRIQEKLGILATQSSVDLGSKFITGRLPNANIVQRAANTLAGNNTGGPADLTDLTPAQVLALLGNGAVPAGTIVDYGGGAVPTGWILCDGSNVSRTVNATLFAALGTTWGAGDGSTTFGVPDLRRRVTMGSGGVGTGTIGNAVGNTGGEEAHTLLATELAVHGHTFSGTTATESAAHTHNFAFPVGTAGGQYGLVDTGNAGSSGVPATASENQSHTHAFSGNTGNAGSGVAHNTIQPSAIVTKMIKGG